MNILHLHLSREFAGSERYAASVASAQAKQGHSVRVVVRCSPHVARWRAESAPADVLVLPNWAIGMLKQWVIKKFAAGAGAQVIHSHLGGAHRASAKVARTLAIPHVGTLHLRYKAKEHSVCNGLIAIAAWQTKEVPYTYKGMMNTIWNGLPPLPAPTPEQTAYIKKAWGGGQQVFTFVSVGRLHPQKGMETLITAFKSAFPSQEGVRLVIVGEGPQRPALEEAIAGDSRIILMGYQTELQNVYAAADAYVSASRHEPFGLTILEAMAVQLPLVCTRTEGPQEYLASQPHQPHWAAIGDTASMAQALHKCLSQNAKPVKWDMSPFAMSHVAEKIVAFYGQVSHQNHA